MFTLGIGGLHRSPDDRGYDENKSCVTEVQFVVAGRDAAEML